jgi:hypothetical protein
VVLVVLLQTGLNALLWERRLVVQVVQVRLQVQLLLLLLLLQVQVDLCLQCMDMYNLIYQTDCVVQLLQNEQNSHTFFSCWKVMRSRTIA